MNETRDLQKLHQRHNEIVGSIIKVLVKYADPEKILLFGSRAKGVNASHADFDFAVEGKEPASDVKLKINEEIENTSGLYKVDIIYLESVEPGFKNIVLKTGKVIYERRN